MPAVPCPKCDGTGIRAVAWSSAAGTITGDCGHCGGAGFIIRTDAASPTAVSDARGPVTGIRSGDAVPTQTGFTERVDFDQRPTCESEIARQGNPCDGGSDVGTSSPAGEPAWVEPTLFDPIDGAAFPTSAAVPVDLSPVVVERAHARRTDPDTSHAAARSVKPLTITKSRAEVLRVLLTEGASTQEEITDLMVPDYTESRCRTAVSELRSAGLVWATDDRRPTRTGRNAIVWALTPKGYATAETLT